MDIYRLYIYIIMSTGLPTTSPQTFNLAYGINNPVAPITSTEIYQMRKRLFDNISDLNGNKHRLRPDEYHQLSNYHHYALTLLDNMKVIQRAEMSDPYNRNMGIVKHTSTSQIDTNNPYETNLKVVYKRNGQAMIADPTRPDNRFQGEWMKQFDANVYNPPCYAIPPSNVWGVPK